MNGRFATLIKREFWEHRSLWIAPLVAAGFLVATALLGALFAPEHVHIGGRMPARHWGVGGVTPFGATPMLMAAMGVASLVTLVSFLTCVTYLLDCLYSERKDRSILFWKSLPVSDTHTVLAKFIVAMVCVPFGVFLLQGVTNLLISGTAIVAAPQMQGIPAGTWHLADWINAQGQLLGMMVATQLWYAPFAAWLLLASVFARRSPILNAIVPVVGVAVCENIVLQTSHIWQFLRHRLRPEPDLWHALALPELWLGLAAAAGMLYIVIRLRRYRDDT